MGPEVSVVIPTHDRLHMLAEVLAGLEAQEGAPSFEVVVVDDGSRDGTAEWLRARRGALPLRVLVQENAGPAAARNTGVAVAAGRWVAFLGDDTVPARGWLATHREAHRRQGDDPHVAVLGYTGWHPRMRLTAFLRYINEHGLQFGYALLREGEDVPFNFFYTSNISLPRDLLLAEPFDLSFPYAAWEDIEVSYRLKKRGLRMIYEPGATVAHDHPTDFRRFAERQERAGYCAVVFYRLHPELGGFLGLGPEGPPPLPSRRLQILREGLVSSLQNLPIKMPRAWQEALRYHYIRGLHRAWREGEGERQ